MSSLASPESPATDPTRVDSADDIIATSGAPRTLEIVAIGAVTMLLTAVVVAALGDYWIRAEGYGDNWIYMMSAEAILEGRFEGLTSKALVGYSYLGAAFAAITTLSPPKALIVLSWVCSLVALVLATNLWGGWVAGFFAVTSVEWIQHAVLGGNESVGLALLFGVFLAARREKWPLAALLAAIAATVRPEAALALVAIGIVLLWRRRFKLLGVCVVIGVVVIGLYVVPMWIAFGDPLANYHRYEREDFPTSLLTVPFVAIIGALINEPVPWTHKLVMVCWIVLVLVGIVAMARTERFRVYARRHPLETAYVALLLSFLFCYNSRFAFHAFGRYVMSALPVVYFALLPWLPRKRGLLWAGAIVSPMVAGASAMSVRRTIGVLRGLLGSG